MAPITQKNIASEVKPEVSGLKINMKQKRKRKSRNFGKNSVHSTSWRDAKDSPLGKSAESKLNDSVISPSKKSLNGKEANVILPEEHKVVKSSAHVSSGKKRKRYNDRIQKDNGSTQKPLQGKVVNQTPSKADMVINSSAQDCSGKRRKRRKMQKNSGPITQKPNEGKEVNVTPSKGVKVLSSSAPDNSGKKMKSNKMQEGNRSNRSTPNEPLCSVRMYNLPVLPMPKLLQEVSELLMKVGEIKSLSLFNEVNGNLLKVKFATPEEAQAALNLNKSVVCGSKVTVLPFKQLPDGHEVILLNLSPELKDDDVRRVLKTFGKVGHTSLFKNPVTGVPELYSVSFATRQQALSASLIGQVSLKGTSLYILPKISTRVKTAIFYFNMPHGTSKAKIKEIFSGIPISGIKFKCNGNVAVIFLKDEADVSKALKLNGLFVKKHEVKLVRNYVGISTQEVTVSKKTSIKVTKQKGNVKTEPNNGVVYTNQAEQDSGNDEDVSDEEESDDDAVSETEEVEVKEEENEPDDEENEANESDHVTQVMAGEEDIESDNLDDEADENVDEDDDADDNDEDADENDDDEANENDNDEADEEASEADGNEDKNDDQEDSDDDA